MIFLNHPNPNQILETTETAFFLHKLTVCWMIGFIEIIADFPILGASYCLFNEFLIKGALFKEDKMLKTCSNQTKHQTTHI